MEYELIVGLEVHVELKTESKVFCGCKTSFGAAPNTQCCPVCSGLPGSLPVLNKKAVEYAIKAGLSTNCKISGYSVLDRKNYFYPDLPKSYQISQLYRPLCRNGHIDIGTSDNKKRIRIREIHLEEDAGKLIHDGSGRETFIDFNRCGVPLIEIVTEPDMRSAQEVKSFLDILKAILVYTDVSDCRMQEGSLRADVNVSIREKGSLILGTRTEMKNLNSFRAITRAVEAEYCRQVRIVENGGSITQETRRWDDAKGSSQSMRNKEEAQDYRYFPEPDLPPVIIDEDRLYEIRNTIPELPEARAARYTETMMLPEYDSSVLTSSKELSDFFEKTVSFGAGPKLVSNWLMGEYMKLFNESGEEEYYFSFKPESLARMIKMIHDGDMTGRMAKDVFREMFLTGKGPDDIVKDKGLSVIADTSEIEMLVKKTISENPKVVGDYMGGNKKVIGFLVGQVMKKTGGSADPVKVNEMINKILLGPKQEDLNK
jgi:aspartyl-tRNA(Asn)/glutamyl-tRNA(Gln) amidotransferase subunit B